MSNPEGNVKRIMCFANVYCKQTKVGSITHYSLHIPLSVGWKTLRCFVFQREKKNYFPGWNGGIFSFEIWTVNCYGLLKKKNAKAALRPAKGWQHLGESTGLPISISSVLSLLPLQSLCFLNTSSVILGTLKPESVFGTCPYTIK